MQRLIRAIYPAQCVACDVATTGDFDLCGVCWRDTQFINGTIYDACGTALPGDFGDYDAKCDDCGEEVYNGEKCECQVCSYCREEYMMVSAGIVIEHIRLYI